MWLELPHFQTLFDEAVLDEKYYESLQQCNQTLMEAQLDELEDDDPDSFQLGSTYLEDEKMIIVDSSSPERCDKEDEWEESKPPSLRPLRNSEQCMRRYLSEINSFCNRKSSIATLTAKRIKVLQRIYLAFRRERNLVSWIRHTQTPSHNAFLPVMLPCLLLLPSRLSLLKTLTAVYF